MAGTDLSAISAPSAGLLATHDSSRSVGSASMSGNAPYRESDYLAPEQRYVERPAQLGDLDFQGETSQNTWSSSVATPAPPDPPHVATVRPTPPPTVRATPLVKALKDHISSSLSSVFRPKENSNLVELNLDELDPYAQRDRRLLRGENEVEEDVRVLRDVNAIEVENGRENSVDGRNPSGVEDAADGRVYQELEGTLKNPSQRQSDRNANAASSLVYGEGILEEEYHELDGVEMGNVAEGANETPVEVYEGVMEEEYHEVEEVMAGLRRERETADGEEEYHDVDEVTRRSSIVGQQRKMTAAESELAALNRQVDLEVGHAVGMSFRLHQCNTCKEIIVPNHADSI